MFGMLYIMKLLFAPLEEIRQCDQGYLSTEGCSMTTLSEHIFSGSDSTLQQDDDWWSYSDDDAVGPAGYNIKNYLIPSQYGVYTFGNPDDIYSNYGLYQYQDRQNIVWMSMLNTTDLVSASTLGLYFSARSPPPGLGQTTDAANNAMYSYQESVLSDTQTTDYPECSYYAPDTLTGGNVDTKGVAQNYSDIMADVVFVCPDCVSLLPGQAPNESQSIYFNGDFWATSISTKSCYEGSCKQYPYGYLNYRDRYTDKNTSYIGEDCPVGIEVMEMNQDVYYYGKDQTLISMTYMNLLSNLLLDPLLQEYSIQGGYSDYGDLNFDAAIISQSQANILTVIAMMLLNGFWPLAVWRLAHERSQDIVHMMR
jgi:hypothetical protein